MNKNFDEELYKKALLLMTLDRGFEADFGYRYVDQVFFTDLVKKTRVGEPDLYYIERTIKELMDELIIELSNKN